MQTKKRSSTRKSMAELERLARERAEEQARRIPWQHLHNTRNVYIAWQEFYLWVRSVLEVENHIPDWLVEILDKRCPGFVEDEKKMTAKAAKNRPLLLRLEDWIDDHIFGFAKLEGWFNAITFCAIREPRYQRAEVCWSECVERWKKARPLRYPSFEEWKDMAAECDDTAHLVPEVRGVMEPTKRVAPDRLADAVSRYIDWEALAYWARPVLEGESELPEDVAHELRQRCPGFLEVQSGARDWQRLMWWIADHYFDDAKAGKWFDAVRMLAHRHPRAIRTMEYADHCDEIWGSRLPNPYPSFDEWRNGADSYIEAPSALPPVLGS
jgi:hypothetical protein